MKYPISIFLFISMFFVWSCAGLGGFPLYSGSYGSQAASRLTPVESPATGLYGYVNDLGMWVIQPKFRSAQRFRNNGLARVQIGVRYGAINMAGKVVIIQCSSTATKWITLLLRWRRVDCAESIYGRPAIPRVDCTVISIIMEIGSLNRNITMHEDSTTRALPLWKSGETAGARSIETTE